MSILRPLSELLVEKVLAERYPDLLRQQVSCHATHIEDDRVKACGSCEKCRRIVGMLTAIGVDPSACGYTQQQIDRCLGDLATKGVHQEREGAEQLAHMLVEKGRARAAQYSWEQTARGTLASYRRAIEDFHRARASS